MQLVSVHDRRALEVWLRRDPNLHLYELGDLDAFFFPHTTWYALEDPTPARRGEWLALALVYTGSELPVVVALARDEERPRARLRDLLERLRHVLPRRFYLHASLGCRDALGGGWRVDPRGTHDRMILARPDALAEVDSREAATLGPADAPELEKFYAIAYTGNWFDPRMLETGAYRGVRRGDPSRIAAVAGVHVLSRDTRAAALGNIATLPAFRGRGLARIVCAALCKDLLAAGSIDTIGLNVLASNDAAVALYAQLGFVRLTSYEEALYSAAAGA